MIIETDINYWNNCSIPERFIEKEFLTSVMNKLRKMDSSDSIFLFSDEDLGVDEVLVKVNNLGITYKFIQECDPFVLKFILKEINPFLFSIELNEHKLNTNENESIAKMETSILELSRNNTISMNLELDEKLMGVIYSHLKIDYNMYSTNLIINNGLLIDSSYTDRVYSVIFINGCDYVIRKLYFYKSKLCLELSNYAINHDDMLSIKSNLVTRYLRNNKIKIFKDLLSLLGIPKEYLNNIN